MGTPKKSKATGAASKKPASSTRSKPAAKKPAAKKPAIKKPASAAEGKPVKTITVGELLKHNPNQQLRGARRMKEFGYKLVNVWFDKSEAEAVADAAKARGVPVATFVRVTAFTAACVQGGVQAPEPLPKADPSRN